MPLLFRLLGGGRGGDADQGEEFEDARSSTSSPQKGEGAKWERPGEMKRVIKATEEQLEKEEVARTKVALEARSEVKAAEVSRQRADKSERLRIKREAYSTTRKVQEIEKQKERAEMRKEYERAMAARKKEEDEKRAARAKERDDRRAAFLEKQRVKKAVEDEAKQRELKEIRLRHEATKQKLAEAEKERLEKITKVRQSLEAQKERRRSSLASTPGGGGSSGSGSKGRALATPSPSSSVTKDGKRRTATPPSGGSTGSGGSLASIGRGLSGLLGRRTAAGTD